MDVSKLFIIYIYQYAVIFTLIFDSSSEPFEKNQDKPFIAFSQNRKSGTCQLIALSPSILCNAENSAWKMNDQQTQKTQV